MPLSIGLGLLGLLGAFKVVAFKSPLYYDGIIPLCREGKRAFADQTFADGHLPADLNLIIKALCARKGP